MAKFVHIGAVDPEIGHGGVEQFAFDLRYAIQPYQVKFLSYHREGAAPWSLARQQNAISLERGMIEEEDTVIADGFYGLGLVGKVKRLIVVCHGSYAGMIREYGINPPPSYDKIISWLKTAAEHQYRAYSEGEVVAVSQNCALELKQIYDLNSTVIRNGVETDLYMPTDDARYHIAEVAGSNERKGSDVIKAMGMESIRPLGFEGLKHERWGQFECAFFPSRYEGGQYAALEAMAMDLKIVAYKSGFFGLDVPDEHFWGTYDYHPRTFKRLFERALSGEEKCTSPREWVLENASFQLFEENWRNFLGLGGQDEH